MTDARRWLLRLGLALIVVVLIDVGWLGVRVLATRSHLQDAQRRVAVARAAIKAGHLDDALAEATLAAVDTHAARGLESDPIWQLDSHLPGIGRSLQAVSTLAVAADRLAGDVVPPLAQVADDVRGDHLRLPAGNGEKGGIDLARLADATPKVNAAVATLAATRATVAAIDPAGLLGPVAAARSTLLTQLDELAGQLDGPQKALRLAPAMLGADGPRTYFVAFENTAEARGIGGILGEYAIVTADHGRLDLVHAGPNEELKDVSVPASTLPDEAAEQWNRYGLSTIWRDTMLAPHYPYAATAIAGLYQRRTGRHLDGVVTLDPTAIGYVLSAAAPVVLPDGTTITGPTFASFLESEVYAKYPVFRARKAVLHDLETSVFSSLLHGGADPGSLLTGLGRAVGERRLLVASTHPDEESQLAAMATGGAFPDAAGPFSAVIVNNASADKLDFYLDRRLRFAAAPCALNGSRDATTTVTLTNSAPDPATLPDYVTGKGEALHTVAVGSVHELVTLYGGVGATLGPVTLDGQPVTGLPGVDRGHPVVTLLVPPLAPRGGAHTLTVLWHEKPGPPQTPYLQPLIRQPVIMVDTPACGP